jgi:GntR family transcriptional regulator
MPAEAIQNAAALRQQRFSERNGTLYAQVGNVMRQRIRSGRWPPGRQIPTLEQLEREFGVARVTLRQALSLLETEGLIWRGRGRGTFVTERAAAGWFKLETSRDQLIHSLEGNWSRLIGVEPQDSVPSLEPADGSAAPAYRHMRRVHGAADEPYAVVDMHLDRRVYELAPARFDSEMIIPVLDSLPEVEIADIRQTFTLGTADGEVAEHLSVPIGSPIGVMRRVVRGADGTAIYVGTVNYRGDVVRIEISLANGAGEESRA